MPARLLQDFEKKYIACYFKWAIFILILRYLISLSTVDSVLELRVN